MKMEGKSSSYSCLWKRCLDVFGARERMVITMVLFVEEST